MNNNNNIITSKSVYSFVAWISSIFVYICYVTWAFLPEETLQAIGYTYYPSKYYAIAIPAYLIVLYILSEIAYIGLNMFYTYDPEDLRTIYDSRVYKHSELVENYNGITINTAPASYIKRTNKESIPEIGDIDIIQLSEVLYQ